jgi:endonuclease G, mitochondrial
MLNLSSNDRQQLRDALTSGFRSYQTLKIFVSDNFEFRLNEFASSTATKVAANDLIEHCEELGKESELILALYKERPHNSDVQKLMSRLQVFFQQRLLLDPTTSESIAISFELPELYTDIQLESWLPQRFSYNIDVGKLQRGLQLANAVCKVSFTDRATTGTGVLIAPDLVLTNYHIISKQSIQERSQLAEKAKTLGFEFGFVSREHSTPVSPDTFKIEQKDPIIACSPPAELDYVLLRLEPSIQSFEYIKPVSLGSTPCHISPNDGLNVLQHPEGNVMQASLSASGVVQVDVERGRVWYVNRTMGGSSGSPCFSDDWQMVALHHASMSRGFGSIREGILFTSILAEISSFLV